MSAIPIHVSIRACATTLSAPINATAPAPALRATIATSISMNVPRVLSTVAAWDAASIYRVHSNASVRILSVASIATLPIRARMVRVHRV